MRTLVISDLHLGQHGGVSVLEQRRPLELLLSALTECDRLVLVGDVIEMLTAHSSHSFPVAEPVLRAIGSAFNAGRPILFIPGNHDHALIHDWSLELGDGLQRETVVPHDASPLLSQMLSWLSAGRVEVRYPGAWLGDGIWATHGHYLNHYLRPVSSLGVLDLRHRRQPAPPLRPSSFEYLAESAARPHMRDGMPPQRLHDRVVPRRLAPLLARGLARQMRSHSLPALAQVARALDVDAEWVVFGHVHRLGPLPGERLEPWRAADRGQSFLNTGSWRFEPVISHRTHPPHPYWPGGAVLIESDGVPRAVNLLSELSESDIR